MRTSVTTHAERYLRRFVESNTVNVRGEQTKRSIIVEALTEMGLRFKAHKFRSDGRNIIVHFGNPWKQVLAAHYDVHPNVKQGANDNGSGTATLLGLAKRLKDENYQGDLTLVWFDQEELLGFGRVEDMGSYRLGQYLDKRDIRPGLFVIVDCVGIGDTLLVSDVHEIEDDHRYDDMLIQLEDCADGNGLQLDLYPTPPSDDYPLGEFGIAALLLTMLPDAEAFDPEGWKGASTWGRMHTETDNIESIDPKALDMISNFLYELVMQKVRKS